MNNFSLEADEVILYEGSITSKAYKGSVQLTLTSKKLVFEKERGVFKKERELLDLITLDKIKFYNGTAQIKQKMDAVELQTIEKNLVITFSGLLEARKFTGKIIDAATGTTVAKRGSSIVKDAINIVDDTLGLDTRGAIKGVLESGVKGAIINGIKKKF